MKTILHRQVLHPPIHQQTLYTKYTSSTKASQKLSIIGYHNVTQTQCIILKVLTGEEVKKKKFHTENRRRCLT